MQHRVLGLTLLFLVTAGTSAESAELYAGVPQPWAGYDAQPSGNPVSYKTSIGAGEVVSMAGNKGGANISCNGTAGNPGFLVGDATFSGEVSINGQYCIIDGANFRGSDGALQVDGSHITVRNITVIDSDTGWGSAVGTGGSNIVLMDSNIGPSGNAALNTDVDHHCFKVSGNNVWILRNEIHDCQGDGIQVGDQNNSPGSIRDIYIVDNDAHGNLQTGYWVKNATDVLIAYNRARDHNTGGGSVAASSGGQYGLTNVFWLYNDFADSDVGIRVASTDGGSGRYFIGNSVQTNAGSGGQDGYGSGWALQSWSSSALYAFDNIATSAAGARDPISGCGNTISGSTHNANIESSCSSSAKDAAASAYQSSFGVTAPFMKRPRPPILLQ